jgi:hypothetical protein
MGCTSGICRRSTATQPGKHHGYLFTLCRLRPDKAQRYRLGPLGQETSSTVTARGCMSSQWQDRLIAARCMAIPILGDGPRALTQHGLRSSSAVAAITWHKVAFCRSVRSVLEATAVEADTYSYLIEANIRENLRCICLSKIRQMYSVFAEARIPRSSSVLRTSSLPPPALCSKRQHVDCDIREPVERPPTRARRASLRHSVEAAGAGWVLSGSRPADGSSVKRRCSTGSLVIGNGLLGGVDVPWTPWG